MSVPGATLDDVLAELRALRREVADLSARAPAGRLLSQRAAAKALGVGRELVGELVRTGRVRTVPVKGQSRIPVAEVERLAAQGIPTEESRPARARGRRARAGGGSIMSISLDD